MVDVSVLGGSRETGEILHPPAPIAHCSRGSGRTASRQQGRTAMGSVASFYPAGVSELRKWQQKIRELKQNLAAQSTTTSILHQQLGSTQPRAARPAAHCSGQGQSQGQQQCS